MKSTEYDELIQQACEKYLPNVDWRLYKAQLFQESSLKHHAVSPAGAKGLAQFMPDTWEEWAPRAGYPDAKAIDAEASIFTGAMYMAHLIKQWAWPRPEMDRYALALASYNAGLGNILKAQKASGDKSLYKEIIEKLPEVTGHHSNETINYVERILKFYVDAIVK